MQPLTGTFTTVRSSGFTLIELMVAIAVLAVLLGIGVPAFTEIIRSNRQAAEVNQFVTALNLARSESAKRGVRVSLCPANSTSTACAASGSWDQGWIVFTDDTGTAGVLDGTDSILQVQPATQGGLTYTSAATSIRFTPSRAEAAVQVDIHKAGCTGQKARRVEVLVTGRIASQRQGCP